MKYLIRACVCALPLVFFSCPYELAEGALSGSVSVNLAGPEEDGAPRLSPLDFGRAAQVQVTMSESGRKVLLVKMNVGDSPVAYAKTGVVSGDITRSAAAPQGRALSLNGQDGGAGDGGYRHYEAAQRFNANPPPVTSRTLRGASVPSYSTAPLPVKGDTKNFWIDDAGGDFTEREGRLQHVSTYADVWALKKSGSDWYLSEADAEKVAEKFDAIYSLETALLGYEYGGGPDGTGGVDANPRVQILFYELPSQGVIGYFWGKDYYTNEQLSAAGYADMRSNRAEIFYMSSAFFAQSPNTVYSTLVHEFQHMIHFNQKTIQQNLATSIWFNEMLSMLAEDCIAPRIGIDKGTQGHPVRDRFPTTLERYWASGVTELDAASGIAGIQYANVYTFGAYLARNYGGPAMLAEMVKNNKIDQAAIEAAAAVCGYPLSFQTMFERYPQALCNKSAGGPTFSRTVQQDGYSFAEFTPYVIDNGEKKGAVVVPTNQFKTTDGKVPPIPARGFVLESDKRWLSGEPFSITVSRPEDSGIRLYMLVL